MHIAIDVLHVRRELGGHRLRPAPIHVSLAVVVDKRMGIHVVGGDDAAGVAAAADDRSVVLAEVLPWPGRGVRYADPSVITTGTGDELIVFVAFADDVWRPDVAAELAVFRPVGESHFPVDEVVRHPDRGAAVGAGVVLHRGGVDVEFALVEHDVGIREHPGQDGIAGVGAGRIDVDLDGAGERFLAGKGGGQLEDILARLVRRGPRGRGVGAFKLHVAGAAQFAPGKAGVLPIGLELAGEQKFIGKNSIVAPS